MFGNRYRETVSVTVRNGGTEAIYIHCKARCPSCKCETIISVYEKRAGRGQKFHADTFERTLDTVTNRIMSNIRDYVNTRAGKKT